MVAYRVNRRIRARIIKPDTRERTRSVPVTESKQARLRTDTTPAESQGIIEVPDDPRTLRHPPDHRSPDPANAPKVGGYRGPRPRTLAKGAAVGLGAAGAAYVIHKGIAPTAKRLWNGPGEADPQDTPGSDDPKGDNAPAPRDPPKDDTPNGARKTFTFLGAGLVGGLVGLVAGLLKGMGFSEEEAQAVAEVIIWVLVIIAIYLLWRAFKKKD